MSNEMFAKNLAMGLKCIVEGITVIIDTLEATASEGRDGGEIIAETVKEVKKLSIKVEDAPQVVGAPVPSEEKSIEDMTYNEIKKLAVEMGIPARGTRDEILARIQNPEEAKVEEAKAPVEDVAPATTKAPSKVVPIKKVAVAPPVEDVVEDEEESAEPTVLQKVLEATAEMTEEELATFLTSVGENPKGKRQALIDKIVKAVEDGKIDLDETEDEGEEAEAPADAQSDDEPSEDEGYAINDTENPDMTAERKAAIEEMDAELRKQYKAKEISDKDVEEYLVSVFGDGYDPSEYTPAEALEVYIDTACNMIDDEGETKEFGEAYTINEAPFCCGSALELSEDETTFTCSDCGTVYSNESE